jgi:hypothetical protein
MPTLRPRPTQPPHRPSCLALAGRVQGSGDQVEAFHGGLVGGEVAAGPDGAAVAGVDRLDRVGGADDLADFDVVEAVADCLRRGASVGSVAGVARGWLNLLGWRRLEGQPMGANR